MIAKKTKISGTTGKRTFNLKHAQWKIGQEVQVPYHPVDTGNYLFADGVIIDCKMSVGKNGSCKYAVVKCKVNGEEVIRKFKISNVFAK